MHVVSTILFQTNAFKNVICTGVIKGTDGQKMSKSLGNYPDPRGVIEKYGGDSFRLSIAGSVLPVGEDLNISEEAIAAPAKDILLPLMNTYKYFALYANQHEFTYDPTFEAKNILDKWVMTRVKQVVKIVEDNLAGYTVAKAVGEMKPLIDDVSTWYIRRSRDRFVAGDNDALQTLFAALFTLVKAFAPIAAFTTEFLYSDMKKALPVEQQLESVHLEMYPTSEELTNDDVQLLANMEVTRKVASIAQSIRVEKGLALKQPPGNVLYKSETPLSQEFLDLIAEELNVSEVLLVSEMPTSEFIAQKEDQKTVIGLDTEITPELAEQGLLREVTRAIQSARKSGNLAMGQKTKLSVFSEDAALVALIKKYEEKLSLVTLLEAVTFEAAELSGEDVVATPIGSEKKILQLKVS
jgi:isoleucyl-tRNA synthetase